MSVWMKEEEFEEIYEETYLQTLKFIIIKCKDLEDVNDLLQNTYLELLKKIKKRKKIEVEKIQAYILGIANHIIQRHYSKKKIESIFSYDEDAPEYATDIKDPFDLEQDIITKENVDSVWQYIRTKDLLTAKIFYLYFALGLKISEVANQLGISEANTKNKIYRTLKEIKQYLGKESDSHD